MPLTTNLADRVRALLQDRASWHLFPEPVREWLRLQKARSRLPGRADLLVETFPRGGRWYLVAYCFEGRNAHQTLGMLVTRRMERFGFAPLGFVATDYVLGIWCANQPRDLAACSIRTCSVTTSKPGWRTAPCCAAPSAMSR